MVAHYSGNKKLSQMLRILRVATLFILFTTVSIASNKRLWHIVGNLYLLNGWMFKLIEEHLFPKIFPQFKNEANANMANNKACKKPIALCSLIYSGGFSMHYWSCNKRNIIFRYTQFLNHPKYHRKLLEKISKYIISL